MLFSRSARTSLTSALACAALLVACTDPEGSYDDFAARDKKITDAQKGSGGGGGGQGDCTLPAAAAADGDYLFALTPSIDASKPVVFLAKMTTAAKDNGLSLSLNLQALQAADRKTPTGSPLPFGPFDVGADGNFTAAFRTFGVPGDGNPISPSDLEATITLAGSLCALDFVCGTITGALSKPLTLDLAGSTFAMVKVTDPTAYPPVLTDCKKTVSPPPGEQ